MPSTVFSSGADADPLAALLVAFLQGDPPSREELPRHIHRELVKLARHFVPSDLAEDAVQQMWVLLLRKTPDSFDVTRVSASRYLGQLLRTAARDVRATYTPPGQRTRPRKDSNGELIDKKQVLSLDAMISMDNSDREDTFHELIADTEEPFETVIAKLDMERLLNEARTLVPQPISAALTWMYENDAGLEESAIRFGLSRFQLSRGIHQLRRQLAQLPLAS